ncbi:M10 family metallopeptidase [Paracoccus denitrificans]|jgi:serralysin|uniref:Peptidase domain protein n=1 Tax=Paracoccus denitrificans (strain Pd 1222) TaxID=318586 RepID=A1B090_PARDP|nr:M10 family metallopeptidase [Paracoccus denitrificans]ABL68934.1 peptidase domain protein [Paracoccus denitrificans PD1222]MBB4625340.1 serralysin [Paracoccus denitrificans]MCU7428166.1 M10 family metallopeptidase C-terminal domain-containing protein [Paracoccus denitrificans]QAR26978.1 peptidase [Paracoccus denitrificans]UPV95937.1 M10 family metallopeptidase C-terminal domain-containing protein [Paracoccus denitrificans]
MTLTGRNLTFADAAGTTLHETAAVARAVRTEGGDAPAGRSTGYAMAVGDTFNGTLSAGDRDWVRVELQPGSYVITLDSRGAAGVYDPYLRVMDDDGVQVAQNDDGDGLNSRLVLNVAQPGTYYLEAGSYAGLYSGAYSLNLAATGPTHHFTMAEIALQLTDGYWEATGRSRRAFDVGQGDVLNVDLSGLTQEGRQLAGMALSAWAQVTGIVFNRNPGTNATIHITFDDSDWGAWSSSMTSGDRIVSSHVNIGLDWLISYGTGYNSYSYQTYIHEIGHALGLGHAGNYNGSAVLGVNNHYLNDSWQASVMSYFDQAENVWVDASFAYIASPMTADILAIQRLYGPTAIRTGNNTYGETTNAGPSYATIAALLRNADTRDDIAFTIFDQGGVDMLDLGTDTRGQRISLVAGTSSNAYGLVGNISIMPGTLIENAQAGRGNDLVIGNWADNILRGGAGNDTLRGAAGNDTLNGQGGADRLVGGVGDDVYVTDGRDQIVEAAGQGIDTVRSTVTLQLGANLENLVLISNAAQDGGGNALANRLTGNAHANRLEGFSGNDTLLGGQGNDTLYGGNGWDVLGGGAGADLLIGGNGNDILRGWTGNDTLRGGAGNDTLNGQGGADRLEGGAGDDVYVTDGRDQIVEAAGQGIDTVRSTVTLRLGANLENLVLISNAAQDGSGNGLANRLTGNAHANRLEGFFGNDTLLGRQGNDLLFGGQGDDWLEGGAGADLLVGGQGDDTMLGGAGADHFVFQGGRDVVGDFQDDLDTLRIDDALWGGGPRSVAQVLQLAHVAGGNTVFDFGNGNVLTLNGFANIAALQDDLIIV